MAGLLEFRDALLDRLTELLELAGFQQGGLTEWSRSARSKGPFDTVIEGLCSPDLEDVRFMITYLNVPNQCRALFDDWELFVLYATTEDFQKLIFIDREMMNEVRDKFWGPDAERDLLTLPRRAAIDRGDVVHIPGFTCKGYLLNENLDKGDPGYVKRPMAVMLRDGRVYVDEKMFRHARYVEMIPEIVRSSGDIFRNIVKL